MPNPNHYVSNQECLGAIAKHREGDTTELARIAHLIGLNVAAKWKNLGTPEELATEAVLIVLTKIDRFDVIKGKHGFNYLTTLVFNHYKQLWRDKVAHLGKVERYAQHLHEQEGGVGLVRRVRQLGAKWD